MLFTPAVAPSFYARLSGRVITRWHTRAYTRRTANTLARNEGTKRENRLGFLTESWNPGDSRKSRGQITRPFCRRHDGMASCLSWLVVLRMFVYFLFFQYIGNFLLCAKDELIASKEANNESITLFFCEHDLPISSESEQLNKIKSLCRVYSSWKDEKNGFFV